MEPPAYECLGSQFLHTVISFPVCLSANVLSALDHRMINAILYKKVKMPYKLIRVFQRTAPLSEVFLFFHILGSNDSRTDSRNAE